MIDTRAQRVFITGVSSGVGLALAQRYISAGAVVGGCDLSEDCEYSDVLYECIDVTDHQALGQAVSDYVSETGGLDVMIACAGINHPKTAMPDFERGREVVRVNLIGVMNAFEAAISVMRQQGAGQLVALGSVSGRFGLPGMAAYGASKAGVMNYCESLAISLADSNIAVTCIVPGFIATPLTQSNDHEMPFVMDVASAADKIFKAIQRRRVLYVLPWQMRLLSAVLMRLPRNGFRWLAARKKPFIE